MNITKLFFTITLCCIVALTSDATAGGGKTGNGGMGNGTPGYGGQGMASITGKIASYNQEDSTLIIRNQRMDTVLVTSATTIMMGTEQKKAEDLKSGKTVTVWYEMRDNQKVATMISDKKNGADQGYGGQGMGTMLTGKIASYNAQDSMLIIRNQRMDTVHITPTTQITINGEQKKLEDLESGKSITVWYQMQNGRKVATRITEAMSPGTGGGRNGCPSPGTGGSGFDTTDTNTGGSMDTNGSQEY